MTGTDYFLLDLYHALGRERMAETMLKAHTRTWWLVIAGVRL